MSVTPAELEGVNRRQRLMRAMGHPDRAWEQVLDEADMGRDLTSSLLLVIACELYHERRRREIRLELDEANRA